MLLTKGKRKSKKVLHLHGVLGIIPARENYEMGKEDMVCNHFSSKSPHSESTSIWSSKLNPKIAIVVNSLRGGGAENAMAELNQYLNARQYTAVLIGINSCSVEVHPELLPDEIEIGRTHLAKAGKTIESFVLFRRTIRDFNPDVLIANCDLPELFSVMLLGEYKTIVVEHSSAPWAGRKVFGVMVRSLLKLMGASFVSISDKIRVWQGPIGSYTVLENPIPKPSFLPKQNEFYLEPRLIFIGRLENQKCPEMFVQIQSKLDIPAVVIGDGRLRKGLEQFSLEKNLKIDFMGFQQDPWSFVYPRDYLLVTSKFEGKPLVILEALSLGIKIFARDIPELREEFKDFPIVFCSSVEDFVDRVSQERRLHNSGSNKNKSLVFDLEKHNRQAINSWIQYLEKTLPNPG